MAHGAQKLFGSFGEPGIEGTAGFHEQLGIKPAKPMAVLAGLAEFVGGILVIAGFLTPLAALALIVVMIVAIVKVHLKNGFFAASGGYEGQPGPHSRCGRYAPGRKRGIWHRRRSGNTLVLGHLL